MKRVIQVALTKVSFTLLSSLTLLTLGFSVPSACAQATPEPSGDSNSIAGNFSLRTFRGCLSGSGNQYELKVGGAVPRQYRLVGSNLAQLDGKAGHSVSITGTMLDSSQSSATNTNATTGESDTINFLSIDDLASTCSASPGTGPAAETSPSPAMAIAAAQQPWQLLTPSTNFIPMPEPQPQRGSYILVPLVGVFALGFLQTARYRRRK